MGRHTIEKLNIPQGPWSAIGAVLKSYTSFKRNKIIQMMYDWQNDGNQKTNFHGEDGMCPAFNETEHHLHYLQCNNE